jgi:NifU-like protein
MWEYNDKVREYFLNPRGAGEMPDANGIGEVGSLACGDALKLYLKVDERGVIQDVTFQTFGCASAIASSSALVEMAKGRHVDEAMRITNRDIADFLGGLPKEKMHCSVMGQEALQAAIRNWKGEAPAGPCQEGTIVCKCFGVTDVHLRRTIRENQLKTLDEVTAYTKAGGACGQCHDQIQAILDEERGKKPEPQEFVLRPKLMMTNVQRMQKILQIIEDQIRPTLGGDGRDIELVDVRDSLVLIRLLGKCSDCRPRGISAHDMIERTLRETVDPAIHVEEA